MFKTSIYVFIISIVSIVVSRLIPHPPNFTSTIAVAFYIPLLFGRRHIFTVFLAFIFTDLILGLHSYILWTWTSIIFIGIAAKYYQDIRYGRLLNFFVCTLLFFILSNFGVWLNSNMYDQNFSGLIQCYYMALPFLKATLASSFFYCLIIEIIINYNSINRRIKVLNPDLIIYKKYYEK